MVSPKMLLRTLGLSSPRRVPASYQRGIDKNSSSEQSFTCFADSAI